MATDYRTKYLDIRAKLMEATDVAYRLGYEEGMKDGQQAAQEQMMQQQMAEQQAMMQQMQGGMPPGAEGGEMPPEAMGGEMPPEAMGGEMPPEAMGGEEGSELDSHIQQLEDLVAKGEKPSVVSMREAVKALADLRKNQKDQWMEKTQKTTSAQKSLVDGILKKWEDEAKSAENNLETLIKQNMKTED